MPARRASHFRLTCGGLLAAGLTALAWAPGATAAVPDYDPCFGVVTVSWSAVPVRECPLTSPLSPNSWVPVYATPIPNPPATTPPPAAWLHSTVGQYFVCHRVFADARFYHPTRDWWNVWWAYTKADDGVTWGWVPEVFFKGGDNDEPDAGLRTCPEPPTGELQPPEPNSAAQWWYDWYEKPPVEHTPNPTVGEAPPEGKCDPLPPASDRRLRASVAFAGSGRAAKVVTTRFGRRVEARGRLTRSDGTPIAGAELCVVARTIVAGAEARPVATVITDRDGSFSYAPARGPSRRMWFVHRSGGLAAAASVIVRVRARVRFEASRRFLRNGQTVELRGTLGRAGRRALIELQARRGWRWQTFGTTRAVTSGRFRYAYTFTRTVGVQLYDLRARVPAQPGLPFATGTSTPVRLRVTGSPTPAAARRERGTPPNGG